MKLQDIINTHISGNFVKAEALYIEYLNSHKSDESVYQLLGTLYLQINDYEKSKKYFNLALKSFPNDPVALNNYGLLEKKNKNFDKALKLFSLNILKNNFLDSWINKINIFIEEKKYQSSFDVCKNALLKFPKNLIIKNQFAISLFNNNLISQSLEIYEEFDKKKNHFPNSLFNHSMILLKTGYYQKALIQINKLIFLEKNNIQAYLLRHEIYQKLLRFKDAENDLLFLYSLNNNDILVSKNLVNFYLNIKKYEKVIFYCDLIIDKNIENDFFIFKKIQAKIYIGNWLDIHKEIKLFFENLNIEKSEPSPLFIKYINDDADVHKNVSKYFWEETVEKNIYQYDHKINLTKNKKVRVGYFSGDFRDHAVFYLAQDIFSNHDKSKFEIYSFSSFDSEDSCKKKIMLNSDFFFNKSDYNFQNYLNLIQSCNLDIAIDLSGHTEFSQSAVFNYEIAKVKINYLGFPGTLGSNKYHYLIADKNIIPESNHNYYYEKIIYLPDTYQPFTPVNFDFNFLKSDFSLPNDKFLISSFSRIEKILPNIFDVWMKILLKYEDIFLVLNINDEICINNLKNYCKKNDFPFEKIIFLPRINYLKNLQRMSVLDLYVDTFPYNGHTTLSDSLFQACVPAITLCGNSFASSVGCSLLSLLDMDNLVAKNESEYFQLIDYYCKNRDKLIEIKKKLIEFKKKNIDRMTNFTKRYEDILSSLL